MRRCYSEWEAVVHLQETEEERASADAELAKASKELVRGNANDKA